MNTTISAIRENLLLRGYRLSSYDVSDRRGYRVGRIDGTRDYPMCNWETRWRQGRERNQVAAYNEMLMALFEDLQTD